MKLDIKYTLNVIIIVVFLISIIQVINDFSKNRKFNFNYLNYNSLKKKDMLMEIDTFYIKKWYYHNTDNTGYNLIEGHLKDSLSLLKITFSKKAYLTHIPNYTSNKIPVYKNMETKSIFLKGSKNKYYEKEAIQNLIAFFVKCLSLIIPISFLIKFIINKTL